MLKLDLIQTVAFAGIVLFIGYGIRRVVPVLTRYNIPAPVVGGLLVAVIILIARRFEVTLFEFDTKLQSPLMIAFFTSIGFGASYAQLKAGGPQVVLFLILVSIVALIQNIVGIALAIPLGMHPLFGVIVGSLTLAGGPATGLAFAPQFEQAGVAGATTLIVASAILGIIVAGLVGGPVATFLIERRKLATVRERSSEIAPAVNRVEDFSTESAAARLKTDADFSFGFIKNLVVILAAMWVGGWISDWLTTVHITLPVYIGAMIVAAIIRNLDDVTGIVGLSSRVVDAIGNAALSLAIVMALMTLKLWELAALVLPLLVILAVQITVVAMLSFWPVYQCMGRDYDSAVIVSGFCGFMLGITPNAMVNMTTLVERYGPAPRAFLVVPMVAAFFIDFPNALLITACLNIWR
jgi:ESS family glutamate:Na+ symporter